MGTLPPAKHRCSSSGWKLSLCTPPRPSKAVSTRHSLAGDCTENSCPSPMVHFLWPGLRHRRRKRNPWAIGLDPGCLHRKRKSNSRCYKRTAYSFFSPGARHFDQYLLPSSRHLHPARAGRLVRMNKHTPIPTNPLALYQLPRYP